jgi:hypothetical protein
MSTHAHGGEADPVYIACLRLFLAMVQIAERDAAKGDLSSADWLAWLRGKPGGDDWNFDESYDEAGCRVARA